MVQFMYDETAKLFDDESGKGFHIYHDALIYLTHKSCQNKLEDLGIKDTFIGPVLDCNVGTVYEGRNVGNSPEMMPLDCSLFADVSHVLSVHCAITSSITKDSKYKAAKFSMATPKDVQSAVNRLWPEMFQNTTRIRDDILKVLSSMKTIISHKGAMVNGIGDRKGRRDPGTLNGGKNWGGPRIKGSSAPINEGYLYPSTREWMKIRANEVKLEFDYPLSSFEDVDETFFDDEGDDEDDEDIDAQPEVDAPRVTRRRTQAPSVPYDDTYVIIADIWLDNYLYYHESSERYYCTWPGCKNMCGMTTKAGFRIHMNNVHLKNLIHKCTAYYELYEESKLSGLCRGEVIIVREGVEYFEGMDMNLLHSEWDFSRVEMKMPKSSLEKVVDRILNKEKEHLEWEQEEQERLSAYKTDQVFHEGTDYNRPSPTIGIIPAAISYVYNMFF